VDPDGQPASDGPARKRLPDPRYPSFAQAIGLVVLYALLFILLSASSVTVATVLGLEADNVITQVLVAIAAATITIWYGLWKAGTGFEETFPIHSVGTSLLMPMGVGIVGLHVVLSEFDNFQRWISYPPSTFDVAVDIMKYAQASLWGTVFLVVIVAPVTEEALFRGLILRGFLRRYSVKTSIVLSSVLFGAVHLNPWQVLPAPALGAVFAWWFIETRSLFPCLFGHALNNSFILLFAPRFTIEGHTEHARGTVQFQPLWFDMLGLLAVAVAGWTLVRAFERNASAARRSEPPRGQA